MSRYIDADAIKYIISAINDGSVYHIAFKDEIDEIPTADVVEVVHGEWIQHNEGVYQEKEKNWWHCSNCGNVIYSEHEDDRKEFHKWCGRCGAYMRGKENVKIY